MRRAALLLAALLACDGASARELWRHGPVSLSASGSIRELATLTHGTDVEAFEEAILGLPLVDAIACIQSATFAECPAFRKVGDRRVPMSLTRFRITSRATLGSSLSATATYDHELRGGFLNTFASAFSAPPESLLGLEDDDIRESDHLRWSHRFYRAHLDYRGERLELTLGRQRIAWGVGRLWNPIDRFSATPPLELELDQSPGVDAVDVRWSLGVMTFLEGVYAPQQRMDDALYALRLHGFWSDTDYSLVAGVFQEARTIGLDFARSLGGFSIAGEVVYTDPERDVWRVGSSQPEELETYWQIVVSIDRRIPIGNGVYAVLEHLYNGNSLGFGRGAAGPLLPFFEATNTPPPQLPADAVDLVPGPYVAPASSDIFGASRVVTLNPQTTGLYLSYEVSPAIELDYLVVYDWNGESAVLFPSLNYTGFTSFEVRAGAQLFFGDRHSAYGSGEHLFFVMADFFF